MTTKKFVNKTAFKDVIVTGTVLGRDGKPMSKSRGNGVDPIEIFDKFGVDATRVYLASIATGADIRWNDALIETYRNFANKIWNATRFCLMNSEGAKVDHSLLEFGVQGSEFRRQAAGPEVPPAETGNKNAPSIADKWIISRLNRTALDVNKALDKYFFHEAVSLLYHFFWDDFCDWYIELVKDEISDYGNNDPQAKSDARTRILTVLEIALRMLHPFMPYLTEELWQKLPATSNSLHHAAYSRAEATIMLTSFPPGDERAIDERAESEMQSVIDLIGKVRNIRAEMQIKPSDRIAVHIAASADANRVFAENEAQILKLARADKLVLGARLEVPKASAKAVTTVAEIAVPLEGLIDFEKEIVRLDNSLVKLETEQQRLNGQLSNANFVDRAPAEKVREIRDRVAEIETQVSALRLNLDALR